MENAIESSGITVILSIKQWYNAVTPHDLWTESLYWWCCYCLSDQLWVLIAYARRRTSGLHHWVILYRTCNWEIMCSLLTTMSIAAVSASCYPNVCLCQLTFLPSRMGNKYWLTWCGLLGKYCWLWFTMSVCCLLYQWLGLIVHQFLYNVFGSDTVSSCLSAVTFKVANHYWSALSSHKL